MSQGELFSVTEPTTHYGPTPTPGMANWKRIALCGVEYCIGGGSPEYRASTGMPETFGSSNLAYVTCANCLAVVDARKAISEAGE